MSGKHHVRYKYSFVDVAVTEAYAILLIPKQIWESVASFLGRETNTIRFAKTEFGLVSKQTSQTKTHMVFFCF